MRGDCESVCRAGERRACAGAAVADGRVEGGVPTYADHCVAVCAGMAALARTEEPRVEMPEAFRRRETEAVDRPYFPHGSAHFDFG